MNIQKNFANVIFLACVTTVLRSHPVLAQDYPSKPIRIILPFATGATDVVTRWLGLKLTAVVGQAVIAEPRTGAGGNIAHEVVAKATPDGYTLLMGAPPLVMNPHLNAKLGYDTLRDFAPITMVATIPNVLVVHPSVPAKTLQELIQLARRLPEKLAYASGGVGSAPHLASELLKSLTSTKILHIPYKGAALGLIGAMSGEVDIVISVASAVAPYVNDGRMRAIAVLDNKRVSSLPKVPTSAEGGMPQLVVVNWYILLAPAGIPTALIERLNSESVKIMRSAETAERFSAIGADPVTSTPEQATKFLRAEYMRWAAVIREAGIKGE
ncbi:MAG: tripartite tricarboxylate transporter substrate binding protein [Betaproteobacteria bacterium]